MWARVFECFLALWLVLSLFLFYKYSDAFLCIHSLICAFLIALFALLSFWHPLRHIHLATLGVALWLCNLSYRTFPDLATPLEENCMMVGLLLLMFVIIPNHANRLPHSWRKFLKK